MSTSQSTTVPEDALAPHEPPGDEFTLSRMGAPAPRAPGHRARRSLDPQGTVRVDGAHIDLTASLGSRFGSHLPELGGPAKSWGSLTATAWLTPRVGLVIAGGSYPVDFTQGFPGGRFVTPGVRLASRGDLSSRRESGVDLPGGRMADELRATARSGVTEFHVTTASDGRRVLRVFASSAAAVDVIADFTSWKPVRLEKAPDGNGWWSVTIPLAPGAYEMNVRVDGGAWLVPPGLTALADEFGGAVGLLVIEER